MLKYKVKASKVTHLTDARYFAAMGVHWLGIDLDSLTHPVQEFKEITEWVEGPIFVPESRIWSVEQWQDFLAFVPCDLIQTYRHLKIENEQIINHSRNQEISGINIFYVDDSNLGNVVELENKIDVLLDITDIAFAKMSSIDLSQFAGIQICGSEEEKVGFKSYDDLDEIFEAIEIEE